MTRLSGTIHTLPSSSRVSQVVFFSSIVLIVMTIGSAGESTEPSQETSREISVLNSSDIILGPNDVKFSPDGKWLAVVVGRRLFLWEVLSWTRTCRTRHGPSSLMRLAFAPNNENLATTGAGPVLLWPIPEGEPRPLRETRRYGFLGVDFHPGERWIAMGGTHGEVEVWDYSRVRLVQRLAAGNDITRAIAFSPDGRLLASGGTRMSIRVWETPGDWKYRTLGGEDMRITDLEFSPDGRYLASIDSNRAVRMWNVRSWGLDKTFEHEGDFPEAIAFSSDGRLLAAGDADTTVRIWNISAGKSIMTLRIAEGNGLSSAGHVTGISFSPNDQLLAASATGNEVKVWDTQTWQVIRRLALPLCGKRD